ncbi:DnaJ-domain-containing protein [Trichoderma cornu-damae]|uniref:DnaJ-domain-containing protein n=1 Tax=Trichoderma cornu-damae TaxID=654480 RepID=A0A9P8QFI3_9HYPO|nr:DnaJ-domain-containing protein [Trichoderma cornu-damae]
MAPSKVTDDYYKILGVTQSAGKDAIRASFKRLAMLHHPDKNPNNPQATAQFQLLQAAYSTLFDPEQRRIYDVQYASIKTRYAKTPDTSENHPPPQGNDKSSEGSQAYRLEIEKLEASLKQLRQMRIDFENKSFEARRECNQSQAALDKLQEESDRYAQEEANRNSWYGYFFATRQSEEERQARQRRMVDNRAARTVREAELKRRTASVAAFQVCIDDLDAKIRKKLEERTALQRREWARQEADRLAEIMRQQAMQRERDAKAREEAERIRREQQAERVRKEKEAERARKEKEAARVRKEQEAERARRAQEASEAAEEKFWKESEEIRKKYEHTPAAKHPSKAKTKTSGGRTQQRGKGPKMENTTYGQSARASSGRTSSCLHRSWWNQEEGSHTCERCSTTTSRYAFRCPGCHMVACAGCRNILKGRA